MRRTSRTYPRAFTLVEMLVAIGIVVLLAGLTVTAVGALTARQKVTRTESVLLLLDTAMQEWQIAADRRLIRADHSGADLQPDTELIFVISEVTRALRRAPDSATILAKIEPALVHEYVDGETPPWIRTFAEEQALPDFIGELALLDAWGVPIYATHPGEVARPDAAIVDTDGTERTINEGIYGVARNRRVCFVSAGPDRRFGLLSEFPGLPPDQLYEAAAAARDDNIYSYPPEIPPTAW